jgi:hypothetical protein
MCAGGGTAQCAEIDGLADARTYSYLWHNEIHPKQISVSVMNSIHHQNTA